MGATLARRLAEAEAYRRIVLVDADEGRARGKALDIAQSGPVHGFDTSVEGCAEPAAVGEAAGWVVADPSRLPAGPLDRAAAEALLGALLPGLGRAMLLFAGTHASALVEAAVRGGVPRARALGSEPVAIAGTLKRCLAAELQAKPSELALSVLGTPGEDLLVPYSGAALGGIPVDRLSPTALRRALEAARRRIAGPVSLAAAAARVLAALSGSRRSLLSVVAALEGEYGQRGIALAVPAWLGDGRIQAIVELSLDPVDRVALDTAAQRRYEAG